MVKPLKGNKCKFSFCRFRSRQDVSSSIDCGGGLGEDTVNFLGQLYSNSELFHLSSFVRYNSTTLALSEQYNSFLLCGWIYVGTKHASISMTRSHSKRKKNCPDAQKMFGYVLVSTPELFQSRNWCTQGSGGREGGLSHWYKTVQCFHSQSRVTAVASKLCRYFMHSINRSGVNEANITARFLQF